jgi:hypothetical protein
MLDVDFVQGFLATSWDDSIWVGCDSMSATVRLAEDIEKKRYGESL